MTKPRARNSQNNGPAWRDQMSTSFAVKLWRAFFDECADAFAAIVRMKTFQLLLDFLLERIRERVLLAAEYCAFDGANGDLWSIGNLFGKGLDGRFESIRGNDIVRDSQTMRRRCIPRISESRSMAR